ncbi:hypothetical protein MKW98_000278, partial [Papaver atlanticum]
HFNISLFLLPQKLFCNLSPLSSPAVKFLIFVPVLVFGGWIVGVLEFLLGFRRLTFRLL